MIGVRGPCCRLGVGGRFRAELGAAMAAIPESLQRSCRSWRLWLRCRITDAPLVDAILCRRCSRLCVAGRCAVSAASWRSPSGVERTRHGAARFSASAAARRVSARTSHSPGLDVGAFETALRTWIEPQLEHRSRLSRWLLMAKRCAAPRNSTFPAPTCSAPSPVVAGRCLRNSPLANGRTRALGNRESIALRTEYVTFGEDASVGFRTGAAPQTMAAMRNLILRDSASRSSE